MNVISNIIAGGFGSLFGVFLLFNFDRYFACVFDQHYENAVAFCALVAVVSVCAGWLLRSAALKAAHVVNPPTTTDQRIAEPAEPARSFSGKLNTNMTTINLISPEMARAILAAYHEHGTAVPFSEHRDAVMKSIDMRDGVFVQSHLISPMGAIGDALDKYFLTKDWYEYVNNDDVLKRLNERAAEGGSDGVPVVLF
ncbi:MAG: hypothetical protein IJW29_06260 [Clostridia bacterium]|nr:hypothetical protein [Clostridia bacterium]